MRVEINHPNGKRYWPEDYLPRVTKNMMYTCPRLPLMSDGSAEEFGWVEDVKTGILMPEAKHDAVFLVMQDLHYIDINVNTIKGAREMLGVLSEIAIYDIRGYIKSQLGSVVISLKNAADLQDWDEYIGRLEEVEVRQENLVNQVNDSDIGTSLARQEKGYIKVESKKGKELLNKIMKSQSESKSLKKAQKKVSEDKK